LAFQLRHRNPETPEENQMENRILIVDDEPNHLKTVQRIFRGSDYQLAFAESGDAAAALIEEFNPDVVILDVNMPGMDGLQLCRRIKSDLGRRGIMVLMLSARVSLTDRMAGYRAEADDYLTKPFEPDELRAKVRILLRLKRTQDELSALNRSLGQQVRMRTRELMEKERQAMIGRMLQGIVHNLRGPLTAVIGNTEIVGLLIQRLSQSSRLDSSEDAAIIGRIEELQHTIMRVVEQAESMLTGLLARSRKESTADRRILNLNEVIHDEMKLLSADHAMGDTVHRKIRVRPDLPPILGNYSDFSQLIYNMVKNAADAMTRMPVRELTITTDMDDANQIIRFQDTGSGISPDNISRIFDLYFSTKADDAQDAAVTASGSGIGLYSCAQIIRSYGGEITVDSELGSGTCFTVLIPRQNEVNRQPTDISTAAG
jgi:signal transduction histidine kinase